MQLTSLDLIKNGDNPVLEEGAQVRAKTPASPFPVEGVVVKACDKFVKIDFNHPLAGEELHFRVKVVDRF